MRLSKGGPGRRTAPTLPQGSPHQTLRQVAYLIVARSMPMRVPVPMTMCMLHVRMTSHTILVLFFVCVVQMSQAAQ